MENIAIRKHTPKLHSRPKRSKKKKKQFSSFTECSHDAWMCELNAYVYFEYDHNLTVDRTLGRILPGLVGLQPILNQFE